MNHLIYSNQTSAFVGIPGRSPLTLHSSPSPVRMSRGLCDGPHRLKYDAGVADTKSNTPEGIRPQSSCVEWRSQLVGGEKCGINPEYLANRHRNPNYLQSPGFSPTRLAAARRVLLLPLPVLQPVPGCHDPLQSVVWPDNNHERVVH